MNNVELFKKKLKTFYIMYAKATLTPLRIHIERAYLINQSINAIVEGSHNADKLVWTSNLLQNPPVTFPVNRVEGLGKVYKSHVKIPVLFAALFLNLTCSKDHVCGTPASSEAALTLGQNYPVVLDV